MNAIDIFLLLLLSFWILLIILQGVTIFAGRGQQERQPPPTDGGRPPFRPRPPRQRRPPPIQIESLTFMVKEPSRIRLARAGVIDPEADRLWPVAVLLVNDRNLAGRVLPLAFKIANAEGRIVYQSSLDHALEPGSNAVYTPDYSFCFQGRDDIREGTEWEIQLWTGRKILARSQFMITADMVKKLQGEHLSSADGEFSRPLREIVGNMEAPPLEDLIDDNSEGIR